MFLGRRWSWFNLVYGDFYFLRLQIFYGLYQYPVRERRDEKITVVGTGSGPRRVFTVPGGDPPDVTHVPEQKGTM